MHDCYRRYPLTLRRLSLTTDRNHSTVTLVDTRSRSRFRDILLGLTLSTELNDSKLGTASAIPESVPREMMLGCTTGLRAHALVLTHGIRISVGQQRDAGQLIPFSRTADTDFTVIHASTADSKIRPYRRVPRSSIAPRSDSSVLERRHLFFRPAEFHLWLPRLESDDRFEYPVGDSVCRTRLSRTRVGLFHRWIDFHRCRRYDQGHSVGSRPITSSNDVPAFADISSPAVTYWRCD